MHPVLVSFISPRFVLGSVVPKIGGRKDIGNRICGLRPPLACRSGPAALTVALQRRGGIFNRDTDVAGIAHPLALLGAFTHFQQLRLDVFAVPSTLQRQIGEPVVGVAATGSRAVLVGRRPARDIS